jgi:hypothetical protein
VKKLTLSLLFLCPVVITLGQTTDLNRVTIGFGAGYSASLDKTYDYTLTTDVKHKLNIQPLNKGAFVISTVVMVKFGEIAAKQDGNALVSQSYVKKKRALQKREEILNEMAGTEGFKPTVGYFAEKATLSKSKAAVDDAAPISFADRLSVNLALNLVNISNDVSFNKNIDGGLGLGYFFTPDFQLAAFYDVSRVSQLRDYVVKNYTGKQVPNGDKTYYTTLDIKDNNLFYNKTISGFSIKAVFSLANKKGPTTTE